MFMASGNPCKIAVFRLETRESALCGRPPSSWHIATSSLGPCTSASAAKTNRSVARPLKQERYHVEQIKMGECCRRPDGPFNAFDGFANRCARRGGGRLLHDR